MAVINVTPFDDITAIIASDRVNEGDILLLEDGIYFQTVNILKNHIRIAAKGKGVLFDGKSTLLSAFTLSNVTGVLIDGINIRNYRMNGILVEGGSGNRIVKNTINHVIGNGIELVASSNNLIWKNEVCFCLDGILLIQGSTNNWVIQNIARECASDGFESFLDPDSNNAFISNIAIKNRLNAFEIFGTNNLAFNNLAIDNGLGFVSGEGADTVAIGNKIEGTKTGTYVIADGFTNYFVGDNKFECNRERGLDQWGQLGTFMDNEFLYHVDTGITLNNSSSGNLVIDNKFVCNIPVSILDNGTNNQFVNNVEKACEPCESPDDICGPCGEEEPPAKDER